MPGIAIINSGGTTDVIVEDNIIEQSAGLALNTGGGSLRWTIRNNLVQNNPGDGVFLASGTSDSVVADNIVINNGSNGIDCNGSGNTFHGNVSNSNGLPGGDIDRNGILISGIANGSSADHNSLVGNETNYNGGSGINIRADAGTTANYNIVSGNVSHDNSGTHNNADGISIDGSDVSGVWIGNAVVGNTVYHNQRYGIEVDGQNASMIQSTVISSNVAIGNGNTGIIAADPPTQDTLIVNNTVTGNGSAQIADLGTTRAVIAGNKENTTDSQYVIRSGLTAEIQNPTNANLLVGAVGTGSPPTTVFRVDGTGKVFADGGFQSHGADFAESMAVAGDRGKYEAGDLLVIDPTADGRLTLARHPYSTLVAGVYSTKPGLLGTTRKISDPNGAEEVPLAVVGIVPCKVTAENGPIQVGDLLVTSSTAGHAMKGTDRSRLLGAVVGKALQSLPKGKGVIQVLITLQ